MNMIKNGGNLCYKLDFAAATSCRDTQASSKAGSRARVGSAYIVGGWRIVSLKWCLTLHQLHSSAKDPRQGNHCSGANKTPSSLLTAVLTKISSENCCSRDHQLTCAMSANPKNCSKSTRPFSSLEWVGSGYETNFAYVALKLRHPVFLKAQLIYWIHPLGITTPSLGANAAS